MIDSRKPHTDEVAERLKIARENAGLKQSEVAYALGVARTTVVAIENGQRQPRIEELQALARLYRTTVNGLLRRESVHVDLLPRFRATPDASKGGLASASSEFMHLIEAELELEAILGVEKKFNVPPERRIGNRDVVRQAEQDANELRARLGLGLLPVRDMVVLLETEIGARVYLRRLDSKIDGLFVYDHQVGPCILLNSAHRRERRNQTAAHELGHLVSARHQAEVLFQSEKSSAPEERYARAFGRFFLMPTTGFTHKFEEIIAGSDRLLPKHVVLLAHAFGVSREAAVRQLEDIGLATRGTWDWFQEKGGITDVYAQEVLALTSWDVSQTSDTHFVIGTRLYLLATMARNKALLTENQLMDLLCLERGQLRRILNSVGDAGEDGPKLPN